MDETAIAIVWWAAGNVDEKSYYSTSAMKGLKHDWSWMHWHWHY